MPQELLADQSTAEHLRVSLRFRFLGRIFTVTPMVKTDMGERKYEPAKGIHMDKPYVSECMTLVHRVERLTAVAEAASRHVEQAVQDADEVLSGLKSLGDVTSSKSKVDLLHYGSPFEFQIIVDSLTPAGLGVLLYAAMRLWGVDFEFRAHRERKRAEYLAAKRIAEALERAPPPAVSSALEFAFEGEAWSLKGAVITEEAEQAPDLSDLGDL